MNRIQKRFLAVLLGLFSITLCEGAPSQAATKEASEIAKKLLHTAEEIPAIKVGRGLPLSTRRYENYNEEEKQSWTGKLTLLGILATLTLIGLKGVLAVIRWFSPKKSVAKSVARSAGVPPPLPQRSPGGPPPLPRRSNS